MQITTVNVNGIRAAVKQRSDANRGMLPWLEQCGSDVVLLQEVRASEKILLLLWHLPSMPDGTMLALLLLPKAAPGWVF